MNAAPSRCLNASSSAARLAPYRSIARSPSRLVLLRSPLHSDSKWRIRDRAQCEAGLPASSSQLRAAGRRLRCVGDRRLLPSSTGVKPSVEPSRHSHPAGARLSHSPSLSFVLSARSPRSHLLSQTPLLPSLHPPPPLQHQQQQQQILTGPARSAKPGPDLCSREAN